MGEFHSAMVRMGRSDSIRSRLACLMGPRMRPWVRGDELQYYSISTDRWLDCQIAEADIDSGAVQVTCRPGYWLQGVELQTKLRPHPSFMRRILTILNPLGWLPGFVGLRGLCVGPRGTSSACA